MTELFRRLRYLLNRSRFDQELADDLEFHREMAARAGGARLGDAVRLREDARAAWGWTWIDRLGQDLRYAARMLWRSPGFTLAAVVTLAVGIGANVAAFGFLNVVVLRPLPVRDPDTLLRFERRSPRWYATELPYPEMAFLREHAKTLSAVLASNSTRLVMEGADAPIHAHFVTSNFFVELGGRAALGRVLDPAVDEAPNADPVVVLSYGFWQRQFGANRSVVGTIVDLNGQAATVVGVASEDFSGLSVSGPAVWAPLRQHPYFVTGSKLLTDFSIHSAGVKMWGRLRPGLTATVAEDELRALVAKLRTEHHGDIWEGEFLPSEPGGYAQIGGGSKRGSGAPGVKKAYSVFALVAALGLLILAVACGNLGGLLLARGVARERELTIRAAVGAGRARLVRQLFTESLLLALLGAAAGVALAYVLLRGVMLVSEAPPWLSPAPDWRVLLFAVGVGVAAAIVFGLAPAWQIVLQRHRASLLRQALIGAEVAASCVLLIVAGLLVRALDRMMTAHPGFDYEQVISVDPGLANHGFASGLARAYLDALQSRLRSLPGIESVALASTPPLGGRKAIVRSESSRHPVDIHVNRVDPPFLHTMQIPLLKGRNLAPGDTQAMVVSESLALLQWPGEDPLGRQFEDHTVVGVAGNARWAALQDPDAVEAYYLAGADDLPMLVALVKTSGPPEALAPMVASVARAIDPKVFPEIRLLKTAFHAKRREAEISTMAVTALGVSALLLACLGIVGLVAYSVAQRTKEIGIRMALGASGPHVLSVVLRQLSRPVVVGLLLGIAGAAALSQVLRRELYGVSHLDPLAYAAAIGLFVVTAALTALVPARRALRVDPLKALRYE